MCAWVAEGERKVSKHLGSAQRRPLGARKHKLTARLGRTRELMSHSRFGGRGRRRAPKGLRDTFACQLPSAGVQGGYTGTCSGELEPSPAAPTQRVTAITPPWGSGLHAVSQLGNAAPYPSGSPGSAPSILASRVPSLLHSPATSHFLWSWPASEPPPRRARRTRNRRTPRLRAEVAVRCTGAY